MNIKLDIPESFYQGEERCGYYVSPEMKKVWAVQLDLLAEFARVCEKHNIKWYADAGTLLGAVRHKGFIPWDDDVDVILMRGEYERLCKVAKDEFHEPYLFETDVFSYATLKNTHTTMLDKYHIQLVNQGKIKYIKNTPAIYIDIFPIDDIPEDMSLIEGDIKHLMRYWQKYLRILKYTYNYVPSKILWKRPIKAAVHMFAELFCSLDKAEYEYYHQVSLTAKKFVYPGSTLVAKFVPHDPNFITRRIWKRSDFSDTLYLPFEMLTLPAPSGYENILDKFYGNWHEYFIRERHASFYDTERSYKYYTEEGHKIEVND